MPTKPSKDLLKFLTHFDRAIQKLALDLRTIVIEELTPCYENIYDAYNAVAIGYGTSDRLGDGICHIAVYAKHVNLGFNEGATLGDPKKILRGSGNHIRHLTIKDPDDLRRPELRDYLRRARKKAGHGVLNNKTIAVVSVVKRVYPVRRRPDGIHKS
jgi:hypothetical protein